MYTLTPQLYTALSAHHDGLAQAEQEQDQKGHWQKCRDLRSFSAGRFWFGGWCWRFQVSNTIHYFTLLFLPSMFAFYNWALRTSDRRSWRLSIIIHSFCLQFNWHPCSNLNWTRERLAKGLSNWLLAPAKESVNFPMSFTEVAIPGQVINSLIHSLILIQRT